VDPASAVDEVDHGRTQVDGAVAAVRGVVDRFSELDGRAEGFRADTAYVEPELAAAMVEVLDVHAAYVVVADHWADLRCGEGVPSACGTAEPRLLPQSAGARSARVTLNRASPKRSVKAGRARGSANPERGKSRSSAVAGYRRWGPAGGGYGR
jgi:hypothetical protein